MKTKCGPETVGARVLDYGSDYPHNHPTACPWVKAPYLQPFRDEDDNHTNGIVRSIHT
jgi:hypothetical protein